MPPVGRADPVGDAVAWFDDRAAAVICAAAALDAKDNKGNPVPMRNRPPIKWEPSTASSSRRSRGSKIAISRSSSGTRTRRRAVFLLRSKCLAAMAYLDYFPDSKWTTIRPFVSSAIESASTGWCGTFGPGVNSLVDLLGDWFDGDYDMNQMHLIPLAYRYYQELSPEAREHLITVILAKGRIHRPNRPDHFTSGSVPNDWSRAGFVSPPGPIATNGISTRPKTTS